MSSRFAIVRRDNGWEAQVWSGSRLVWFTQKTYNRRRDAQHAIDILKEIGISAWQAENIRETDERIPPFVATIEPPFRLGTDIRGNEFWHDSEYHWRQCTESCPEGTPPVGALVSGRFGRVEFKP